MPPEKFRPTLTNFKDFNFGQLWRFVSQKVPFPGIQKSLHVLTYSWWIRKTTNHQADTQFWKNIGPWKWGKKGTKIFPQVFEILYRAQKMFFLWTSNIILLCNTMSLCKSNLSNGESQIQEILIIKNGKFWKMSLFAHFQLLRWLRHQWFSMFIFFLHLL